jgi:hypothetical protein
MGGPIPPPWLGVEAAGYVFLMKEEGCCASAAAEDILIAGGTWVEPPPPAAPLLIEDRTFYALLREGLLRGFEATPIDCCCCRKLKSSGITWESSNFS